MQPLAHFLLALTASTAVFAQTPVAPVQPAAPVIQAVPAPATPQPIPANRWTVAQIRQSFDLADTDSNGQLSRSEAQRLAIMPRPFEDMDQNKDGVISSAEYEGSFAR